MVSHEVIVCSRLKWLKAASIQSNQGGCRWYPKSAECESCIRDFEAASDSRSYIDNTKDSAISAKWAFKLIHVQASNRAPSIGTRPVAKAAAGALKPSLKKPMPPVRY